MNNLKTKQMVEQGILKSSARAIQTLYSQMSDQIGYTKDEYVTEIKFLKLNENIEKDERLSELNDSVLSKLDELRHNVDESHAEITTTLSEINTIGTEPVEKDKFILDFQNIHKQVTEKQALIEKSYNEVNESMNDFNEQLSQDYKKSIDDHVSNIIQTMKSWEIVNTQLEIIDVVFKNQEMEE